MREAVRREVARVRDVGAHRWLERAATLCADIEASAAAYESASGRSAHQFVSASRSSMSASGRGRAETLTQQEQSNVSAQRAAELLGVNVRTVRRLAAASEFRTARKVGRDWVIDTAEVIAMKGQP